MTKEQALALKHGDILHHIAAKNVDGTPLRARVNGKVKTWKTRPGDFEIPVKHGLHDYFYIGKFKHAATTIHWFYAGNYAEWEPARARP
jgi:hypothetical protein